MIDDFLIAMILVGFALAGAYLRAEYALHVRSKAAERNKTLVPPDSRVAQVSLEQNGISVQVRIVHAPLQSQSVPTALLTRGYRMTRKTLSHRNTPSINVSFCAALVLLCLACKSVSAADTDAPQLQSLSPGMRVRILAPDLFPAKVIGTVNQVSEDSVSLNIPGRSEPVSISREKIARLDVSAGPHSRGVDSAIGAVLGAAVGAVGCAAGNGSGQGHIVSTGAVAGFCALVGGGLGALIGALVPPSEHWKPNSASRYRFSLAPRLDHGADLAVGWKF